MPKKRLLRIEKGENRLILRKQFEPGLTLSRHEKGHLFPSEKKQFHETKNNSAPPQISTTQCYKKSATFRTDLVFFLPGLAVLSRQANVSMSNGSAKAAWKEQANPCFRVILSEYLPPGLRLAKGSLQGKGTGGVRLIMRQNPLAPISHPMLSYSREYPYPLS